MQLAYNDAVNSSCAAGIFININNNTCNIYNTLDTLITAIERIGM